MRKNIHVVPNGNRWKVKREGIAKPISSHRTKDLADQSARPQARKDGVELITHGKDGRIQEKDSFGKDPCPPKDKKH